jgi:Holliday junction resolvase RusA-like endonuclease
MTAEPVTIVLLGEPVPFARTRRALGGALFTPTTQRIAAAALRYEAQAVMQLRKLTILDEPLRIDLSAEVKIPASWSKKKQWRAITGGLRPAKKPDLDNLYKLAADALCGIVFRDDCLIVDMHCRKVYSGQPKLVVTVQPIDPAASFALRAAE